MEHNIKPGTKGHLEMTVKEKDTAAAYGSGLVKVFATPAMIALMENTAHSSVQPLLPEGYMTVGFEVNIRHVKATPVGMKVSAQSELTEVDGKKLVFTLTAHDEEGEIGKGVHTRYIIHGDKFMEKAGGKK